MIIQCAIHLGRHRASQNTREQCLFELDDRYITIHSIASDVRRFVWIIMNHGSFSLATEWDDTKQLATMLQIPLCYDRSFLIFISTLYGLVDANTGRVEWVGCQWTKTSNTDRRPTVITIYKTEQKLRRKNMRNRERASERVELGDYVKNGWGNIFVCVLIIHLICFCCVAHYKIRIYIFILFR